MTRHDLSLPPPVSSKSHNRPEHIPPPIIVSGDGDRDKDIEEQQKEKERLVKKRHRKQNEELYRSEQEKIADVVRRKNNETMRELNFSTAPKDKKHKKVLQIKS